MAHLELGLTANNLELSIPYTEKGEKFCVHVIKVQVGPVWWLVKHRYNDFFKMHEEMVSNFGIRRDLIPVKSLFRKNDSAFVQQRRIDLEYYLKQIVQFLSQSMPQSLKDFLCMSDYEIYSVVQRLARLFSEKGEAILASDEFFVLDSVELYSITRRTNLPCSPAECSSPSSSFVNVLDIVSRLRKLRIQGSNDFYKSSNLIPNLLPVSFLPFKSIENLILSDFLTTNVSSISTLRPTVNSLTCQNCQLSSIAELLLCDVIHRDNISDEYRWSSATNLNLKSNKIESIDEAVVLLEKLEVLDLSNNLISSLENNFLTKLPHLVALILTNNRIKILDSLHMKVGNLVKLNISHNKLSNLNGLSKLYSLEQLEAGWNCIEHLESVKCVSSLPCLQRFVLNGNPVASIVDYRIKIFSLFGHRMSEIYFDNERPLPKEIDKALVLHALRIAQEKRLMSPA